MRRPLLALALLALLAPTFGAACDTPPQVVEISPERGAQQVPSNADIRIRFDRPVDRDSVASRFSVRPQVGGTVTWTSPSTLVFHHQPLRPATTYSVRLTSGYRDTAGHVNGLDHGWTFVTEAPPALTGASPAPADQNVDPSTDIVLAFTRPMELRSMATALTITPAVRYTLATDPADSRKVVVAPQTLLDGATAYSVTVTRDALDIDGNPLDAGFALEFATGAQRPLRHWVTFGAAEGDGTAAIGIWMVDSGRLPRAVASLAAQSFSWSEDGTHLLVQGPGGAWSDALVGGGASSLPFSAGWAAFLAPGRGFLYLDHGRLARFTAEGRTVEIDTGVSEAAVAPGGLRIAYVVRHGGGASEIRGYDVDLNSRYRLQGEADAVDGLAWAPDGSRLAYRLATADPVRLQVRVRDLTGVGRTVTVGIGDLDPPTWQADSRHVILSASVAGPAGPAWRAFRISATDATTRPLSYSDAIPSPPSVEIRNPAPSPDGHTLAFLAGAAGGDQVWVMNADGTGLAQLTRFDPASFPYSCLALTWTRS